MSTEDNIKKQIDSLYSSFQKFSNSNVLSSLDEKLNTVRNSFSNLTSSRSLNTLATNLDRLNSVLGSLVSSGGVQSLNRQLTSLGNTIDRLFSKVSKNVTLGVDIGSVEKIPDVFNSIITLAPQVQSAFSQIGVEIENATKLAEDFGSAMRATFTDDLISPMNQFTNLLSNLFDPQGNLYSAMNTFFQDVNNNLRSLSNQLQNTMNSLQNISNSSPNVSISASGRSSGGGGSSSNFLFDSALGAFVYELGQFAHRIDQSLGNLYSFPVTAGLSVNSPQYRQIQKSAFQSFHNINKQSGYIYSFSDLSNAMSLLAQSGVRNQSGVNALLPTFLYASKNGFNIDSSTAQFLYSLTRRSGANSGLQLMSVLTALQQKGASANDILSNLSSFQSYIMAVSPKNEANAVLQLATVLGAVQATSRSSVSAVSQMLEQFMSGAYSITPDQIKALQQQMGMSGQSVIQALNYARQGNVEALFNILMQNSANIMKSAQNNPVAASILAGQLGLSSQDMMALQGIANERGRYNQFIQAGNKASTADINQQNKSQGSILHYLSWLRNWFDSNIGLSIIPKIESLHLNAEDLVAPAGALAYGLFHKRHSTGRSLVSDVAHAVGSKVLRPVIGKGISATGGILSRVGDALGFGFLSKLGSKISGKGSSMLGKIASGAFASEEVYKVFVVNWPDSFGGGGPFGSNRFSSSSYGSRSFSSSGKPRLRLIAKDGKIIDSAVEDVSRANKFVAVGGTVAKDASKLGIFRRLFSSIGSRLAIGAGLVGADEAVGTALDVTGIGLPLGIALNAFPLLATGAGALFSWLKNRSSHSTKDITSATSTIDFNKLFNVSNPNNPYVIEKNNIQQFQKAIADFDRSIQNFNSYLIGFSTELKQDLTNLTITVNVKGGGVTSSKKTIKPNSNLMLVDPNGNPIVGGPTLTSVPGNRIDPFTGEVGFHPGYDIAAMFGTAIRAPQDQYVMGVGANPVYGQYVVAQGADGLARIYGHLSTATVSKGQYVPRGSILGHVGSSGRSTGPHVHYEILGSGGPTGVSGFYPYAEIVSNLTGLPVAYVLTQWQAESSLRPSAAVNYMDNNYAGIKWWGPKLTPYASGPGTLAEDGHSYAHYNSVLDFAYGYAAFLKSNSRYSKLLADARAGKPLSTLFWDAASVGYASAGASAYYNGLMGAYEAILPAMKADHINTGVVGTLPPGLLNSLPSSSNSSNSSSVSSSDSVLGDFSNYVTFTSGYGDALKLASLSKGGASNYQSDLALSTAISSVGDNLSGSSLNDLVDRLDRIEQQLKVANNHLSTHTQIHKDTNSSIKKATKKPFHGGLSF